MIIQSSRFGEAQPKSKAVQRLHPRFALVLPFFAVLCACVEGNIEHGDTKRGAPDDLSACILKTMELDEGQWEYVGAIARVDGGVRTYEITSVHSANGDGT